MAELPTWLKGSLPVPAAITAGFALAHSVTYRGVQRSLLFGTLALGLPALGEYTAVNGMRTLRHHTHPQVKGVPVGAVLSWYAISYATFSTLESIVSASSVTPKTRRVLLPASTAVAATSLDLLLDCFGLDLGMWEWTGNGAYARDIKGVNGKRGIPLSNFAGWIVLTGGVSLLYLLLTPDVAQERSSPAAGSSGAGRQAACLLLPYYLPAVLWALARRKPRYLLYSAAFPLMLWRAFMGGRRGEDPA